MVCFVQVCKRLRTLLHSNNKYVVILIDHKAIYNIVNATNLNTLSIDRTNRRLTNVSVYLSIYSLDVYHMLGQFNLVLDVLSYLRILGDNTIRTDEITKPALDIVQDKILKEEVGDIFLISFKAQGQILLICSEVRMADEH